MDTEQESKKRSRDEEPNSSVEPAVKKAKVEGHEEQKEEGAKTVEEQKKEVREKLLKLIEELDIKEEDISKLEDERNPEEVFGLVKRSEVGNESNTVTNPRYT